MRVLTILAEARQPLSVTEVATRQRVEKSTASRLLRTLERHGLVERDGPRGRFGLGLRLIEFARGVLDRTAVPHEARPLMLALRDETNESAHLAVFRADRVIYIDKAEAPTFIQTRTEVGDLAPLHCTATGKAILAWLPEPDLRRLVGTRRLPAYTTRTLTTWRKLLPHLREVQAQGYAVDDEEYVVGVRCVAAPLPGFVGSVIGSVGVSGLASRLTGAHLETVTGAVLRAARHISRRLGGPVPDRQRAADRAGARDGRTSRS